VGKERFFLVILILVLFFLTSFGIVKAVGKGFCPYLEGGLVPCGRQTDDPKTLNVCECYPCELCHLFILFKRVVDFLTINIIVPLAILMIVIGGIMFLTAAGDPGRISGGKKILTAAVIGFAIFFLAWMIVNTIVFFTSEGRLPLPGEIGKIFGKPWYEIACPYCGDGICDPHEDPVTCPLDCMAFIWVPLSGIDKLAQISLEDGSLINTYDVGDDPSRLTVIPGGDVWVANRGSANVTRLSPDWDNLPKYKFVGTYPVGNGPRGVTYDLNGNIWVGNCLDRTVMKLDPESGGQLIPPINVGGGGWGPYGAIGDPFGYVWIANREGEKVDKIDISNNSFISIPLGVGVYGIGMDNEGDIWVATWENANCLMWQIDRVTNNVICYPPVHLFGGAARGRGIAVDGNNNVWVVVDSDPNWPTADSYIYKFDNKGNYITRTQVGQGAVGVTVDKANNIWVVNFGGGGPSCTTACPVCSPGDCGSVTKLNNDGSVIATYHVGGNPYNYSDMTGFRSMGCPKPR